MTRIVLAYSGDLDSTVAIGWLAESCSGEIVTVTLDVGQGHELKEVRDRALAAGAVRAHVLDVREEFARDYVLPVLAAGALSQERFPITTPLVSPLIARKLVEIAAIEHAAAIAHGCTGDDQGRLEAAVRALDPAIGVIAPAEQWGMTRPAKIEFARSRGLPVPGTVDAPYFVDANLWGRSIECGALDDPWLEPPEEIYTQTKRPTECPDQPAYVDVSFERGCPTAINGIGMPIVELIASLSTIAGAHGVGRIDRVENRAGGRSSRRIDEAPAAVVLDAAHRELQHVVTTRESERFSRLVSAQYADIVSGGLWFTPLRAALDAYVVNVQQRVCGVVRMKLFKGDCRVVGRTSPFAVNDRALATTLSSHQ